MNAILLNKTELELNHTQLAPLASKIVRICARILRNANELVNWLQSPRLSGRKEQLESAQ